MNVIDILKKLGWEIISADNLEEKYTIVQSSERITRADEQLKTVTITIGQMCFDETGNLYVEFIDDKNHKFVDNYIHNGMEATELY